MIQINEINFYSVIYLAVEEDEDWRVWGNVAHCIHHQEEEEDEEYSFIIIDECDKN